MAGLIDPNDIAKARQSGYSDQEISDFLADKHPDQFKTARDAGYSDKEILNHLAPSKSEEPSGVIAGVQHGIAEAVRGDASTIGLTGASTPGLDAVANSAEPKNYKGASPIREGGNWYNPLDYQPSAIPQKLAEQAPGLAQDMATGWAAGKVSPGNAYVKGLVGTGAAAASTILRNFGPGAHANADAATGVPNSPVTGGNILREVGKQAAELPLNMVGLGRVLPGAGKLAGTALEKYLKTVGIEAGTGAATDVIDQAATTAGSKDGFNVDLNRTATSALTRAAGSGILVAPKLAAETAANAKYGKIEADPDQQLAAQALAKRQLLIADGRNLVGPLGGTKVAAEAVNGAHTDVHSELADATKGEDLSQDNTNTLSRINKGDKVSPTEVKALADEASPDTMHLARQAMLSANIKATGGLSGAMENMVPSNLAGKTAAAGIGLALGHSTGLTLPVVGAGAGVYGLSRMIDKLTGQRSPAQSFTDRFGGTDAPVRLDTPAPADDPYNPSAGPWGARGSQGIPSVDANPVAPQPNLRATLNANSKVEEGMAKIAKQLSDQKRKSMISDAIPALQQLAATRQPPAAPAAPEAPNLSPIALKMLQQQLKQGLPAEAPPPVAPPAPAAPVDAFDALSPLMRRQRAIMRGLSASSKQQVSDNIAQRKAAGVAQAESLAGDSHVINEQGGLSALSNPEFTKRGSQLLSAANVMRKLTAQPEEAPAEVSNAPASPAISALMQKLQAQPGGPVNPAPPAANTAPISAPPTAPQPPLIAKITKKMGKPMEQTPAPEAEQPYTPIPEEGLWRKHLSDEQVADAELSKYSPKVQAKYRGSVIDNRSNKRDIAENIASEHSPADAQIAADLYHQLDTHSRRTEARKAIRHYTAHMSTAAAAAVHSHFTDKAMKEMWHSE
jgi:hypothetical protein